MRLWLLALCWLASCALLERELPPDLRPDLSRGVAPWTSEPLLVCQEGLRVAPLAIDAVAYCGAGAGVACTADGDCGARERCACDRCVPLTCAANEECASGERCVERRCLPSCDEDLECASGRCLDHGCLALCEDGCARGESCVEGACLAVACNDPGDCAGATCDPVVTHSDLGDPVVWSEGARLHMWLARDSHIAVATSDDGRRWDLDPAPLLSAELAWEAGRVGAPARVEHGGEVLLYYEGGDDAGIGLAVVNAGGAVRLPEPVLVPAEPWESGAIGDPTAASDGASVVLYYDAGRDAGIGLAESSDGRTFARTGSPVLTAAALDGAPEREAGEPVPEGTTWYDVVSAGDPHVALHVEDGRTLVQLWFAGRGRSTQPHDGEDPERSASIAYAAGWSRDALEPYPWNPVLDRVVSFVSYRDETGPAIVRHLGAILLYYTESSSGSRSVRVAVNQ